MSSIAIDAREKRCPLWALAAPGLYLVACVFAVRGVLVDHADAGVAGLLAAVGLLPAFAVPAVFTTRRVRVELGADGVLVGGRAVKIDDARLEHAARGGGVLYLTTRTGAVRTFFVPSHEEALRLVAALPPTSAPAGALAA